MKLIIITGQTATGKTKYALEFAAKNNGELINADARQIYRGLDIITGKDFSENQKIQLYDIVDPKQYFSSFDWVQSAIHVIRDILGRGKTPIIVGGTYFYLYHLLYEVATQHIKPDWKLRNRLNTKSVRELQNIFRKLNIQSFHLLNNSDRHNPQRLIRKIEILATGKDIDISSFKIPSSYSLSKKIHTDVRIEYLGLRYKNIHQLEEKIKERVEKRVKNGAFQEVRKLLKQGYSATDPGLKTIGYSQIIKYIKRGISKDDAIKDWITKEIQYAKRQYTFMKKDPHIRWIYV